MAAAAALLAVFVSAAALFSIADTAGDLRDEFRESVGAEKILIINGDDFGKSRASNEGIRTAFEKGILTTTTIITPGHHVDEAFKYLRDNPARDAGVHFAITNDGFKPPYGSVLPADAVRSLLDENGVFFTSNSALANMKRPEIRAELEAQIRKALDAGVDVTHLDCHMGFYHFDLSTFNIVVDLAEKYGLPIRWPNGGFERKLLKKKIMTTNILIGDLSKRPVSQKEYFLSLLAGMKPGIAEIVSHPAARGLDEDNDWRIEELAAWLDPEVKDAAAKAGVRLMGYRELRDFQREKQGWKKENANAD